jgi:hypothetical protein
LMSTVEQTAITLRAICRPYEGLLYSDGARAPP